MEIWNRFLRDALPRQALEKINHLEKELQPFYVNLHEHFERLTKMLKEE